MRILFVGGTGIISTHCAEEARDRGWRVTLLNRGHSGQAPEGCEHIRADIHDVAGVANALGSREFDAVVDWITFEPEQVASSVALFSGRAGQWVFISTASAYQKPPLAVPITEKTPLENPFWAYSRAKIACEALLCEEMEKGFPATIVRPSHTYGRNRFPFPGGYTYLDRIRRGKPIALPGDGTSLWTMTHARDFATGLVGLLGNPAALGEDFHITAEEWLSWNRIFEILGVHLGREPVFTHLPSSAVMRVDQEMGAGFWGDKAHSLVFDNSKIKRFVPGFEARIPFAEGARDIVDWYDEDMARRVVDPEQDRLQDQLAALYAQILEAASSC
jgi:nucleoside-diphosphate-sugar epimerase